MITLKYKVNWCKFDTGVTLTQVIIKLTYWIFVELLLLLIEYAKAYPVTFISSFILDTTLHYFLSCVYSVMNSD